MTGLEEQLRSTQVAAAAEKQVCAVLHQGASARMMTQRANVPPLLLLIR